MSDHFYTMIFRLAHPILQAVATPTVLHRNRANRRGAYILASNHLSPFDIAIMILLTPRMLDFLSIVELRRRTLVRWFFEGMNVIFLDRATRDTSATKAMADRLRRGRVVALYPEGAIRSEATSCINGGPFKPGMVRLAQITGAPLIPCVVLDAPMMHQVLRWLPIKSGRFGIIYGQPIHVPANTPDDKAACAEATERIRQAYIDLARELRAELNRRHRMKYDELI